MASENEKVMDVLEEMRVCATAADPTIWGDARIAQLVIATKKQQLEYCDRIEAAWKREHVEIATTAAAQAVNLTNEKFKNTPVGNSAALREALVPWISLGEWLIQNAGKDALGQGISEIVSKLRARVDASRAALSLPRRQCDVGTVEEQKERFEWFCDEHWGSNSRCGDCCENCPISTYYPRCSLGWAQMPYAAEEGGAK